IERHKIDNPRRARAGDASKGDQTAVRRKVRQLVVLISILNAGFLQLWNNGSTCTVAQQFAAVDVTLERSNPFAARDFEIDAWCRRENDFRSDIGREAKLVSVDVCNFLRLAVGKAIEVEIYIRQLLGRAKPRVGHNP